MCCPQVFFSFRGATVLETKTRETISNGTLLKYSRRNGRNSSRCHPGAERSPPVIGGWTNSGRNSGENSGDRIPIAAKWESVVRRELRVYESDLEA